jgi:hypothetical protein
MGYLVGPSTIPDNKREIGTENGKYISITKRLWSKYTYLTIIQKTNFKRLIAD